MIFPKNIITFKIIVVNYDDKNGFSSIFKNLFSNNTSKPFSEGTFKFVNELKTYDNLVDRNINSIASHYNNINKDVLEMAESMSAGKASMADLDAMMQQSSASASAFGNTLKSIGVNLLNFGINAAIMAGITLAVKAINDYVHEFENAVNEKPPN